MSSREQTIADGRQQTSAPKSRRNRQRVTSYDVARHVGVSQSVVSRCFRPGSSVSEHMRARVLKGAADLGYQPNAMARSLITGKSGIVGLIVMEQTGLNVPELLLTLSQGFADKNYRMALFVLKRESERHEVFQQVLEYQLDGVVAAIGLSAKEVALLNKKGVSVVFYNRFLDNISASAAYCDQAHGIRILVDHLASKGHKRFAFIGGATDSPIMKSRKQAFEQRIEECGVKSVAKLDSRFDSFAGGWDGLLQLTSEAIDFTALVCANDAIAMGAYDAAIHERNLSIPDDLAITGFDGLSHADWPSYQITTIRQPTEQMFGEVVRLLLDHIERPDRKPSRVVLQGEFHKGQTT